MTNDMPCADHVYTMPPLVCPLHRFLSLLFTGGSWGSGWGSHVSSGRAPSPSPDSRLELVLRGRDAKKSGPGHTDGDWRVGANKVRGASDQAVQELCTSPVPGECAHGSNPNVHKGWRGLPAPPRLPGVPFTISAHLPLGSIMLP